MTQEEVEQLLKPRVIVTGVYPNSKFSVGEILIPNREDGTLDNWWVTLDKNDRRCTHVYVHEYPHLFRPLHWSEHRQESEMPIYVKTRTGEPIVNNVLMHFKERNRWNGNPSHNRDCCITDVGTLEYDNLLPATLEEYTTYTTNKG